MDMNILIYALALGLLAYMVYTQFKTFKSHTDGLQKLSRRTKFEVHHAFSFRFFVYGGVIIGSIGALIYSIINRNTIEDVMMWYLVWLVLLVSASSEIIRTYIMHTVYYNDEGFYNNGEYTKYKSIKEYKARPLNIVMEVSLYTGKSILVPAKVLQFLQPHIDKAKGKNA